YSTSQMDSVKTYPHHTRMHTPICNHCTALGHKEHVCPMKEGIMALYFCDNAMEEDEESFRRMVDANYAFLWGEDGHYILINPFTQNMQTGTEGPQAAVAKAESLATSSIDLNQIQIDKEEIGQTSKSETNSQAGATMENAI
ncbi:hypothetical protein L0F63_003125, partial [Massospora cicadina]